MKAKKPKPKVGDSIRLLNPTSRIEVDGLVEKLLPSGAVVVRLADGAWFFAERTGKSDWWRYTDRPYSNPVDAAIVRELGFDLHS